MLSSQGRKVLCAINFCSYNASCFCKKKFTKLFFVKIYFMKLQFVFAFFRLIHFRDKMPSLAKKVCKIRSKRTLVRNLQHLFFIISFHLCISFQLFWIAWSFNFLSESEYFRLIIVIVKFLLNTVFPGTVMCYSDKFVERK